MTPKQQRFIDEYLIDLNATQAAIRAGYSAKTAQEQSSRLLSNVMVAAEISKRQEKLADKYEVTQDRIVRELALLGFSNMADYTSATPDGLLRLDLSRLTRDQSAAIAEMTVDTVPGNGDDPAVTKARIKLADKRGALVDLGKHLGMFKEKLELGASQSLLDALSEIHANRANSA